MENFTNAVWRLTKKIPRGRVATYAAIARALEKPHASRAVGNALNKNLHHGVPCHRVVRSDGSIGGFAQGSGAKKRLLEKEGVVIKDERVSSGMLLHKL